MADRHIDKEREERAGVRREESAADPSNSCPRKIRV
jgi:hypothetical protein